MYYIRFLSFLTLITNTSYLFWHSSHYHTFFTGISQWFTLDSLFSRLILQRFSRYRYLAFSQSGWFNWLHAYEMTGNDGWHASMNDTLMTRKLVNNVRLLSDAVLSLYSFIGLIFVLLSCTIHSTQLSQSVIIYLQFNPGSHLSTLLSARHDYQYCVFYYTAAQTQIFIWSN